jgi:glycosyltransferase involved in cell wall biosynthesis
VTKGTSQYSVLCVTDSQSGHATAGVRGAFYRRFFEGEGWNVKTVDVVKEGRQAVLGAARDCHWVVLIKTPSLSLARALRAETRAVLAFDFSDALWKPVHRRAGWHDLERILGVVDAVFCENDYLAPFARRCNPHVFTAPTAVPLEAFDAVRASVKKHSAEAGSPRTRVGWVGSRTTVGALEKVRVPLGALAARHPGMELRVLGASESAVARALGEEPRDPRIPRSVLAEYDEGTMIREMLALDVGIYPAPFDTEDYAARGPLKVMLYMAAGLPIVCEPGGDCSRLLRDGESGMFASSPEEWERKLEALLVSTGLRARMGAAALEVARAAQHPDNLFGELRTALATVRRGEGTPPAPFTGSLRSGAFRLDALVARGVRAVRRSMRLFPGGHA